MLPSAHGTHRSECCVAFLLQPAELAKRSYARLVASDAVHLGRRLRFDPTLPNPAGIRSFLDDMYRCAEATRPQGRSKIT